MPKSSTLQLKRVAAVLLILGTIAARLPLVWDKETVRNDGAEYLAIARHLRTTGEFATDLKYGFWTDDPVHHSAWGARPPLYPAIAALCSSALPTLDATAAVRLGNALLSGLAAFLALLYLQRFYSERTAYLATAFVFLLPHTVYWTAQPMTEAAALVLTLGALLLWPSRPAFSGVLIGLLYLTRPTGAFVLAALLLDAVIAKDVKRSAGLLAGFAVPALPYHAWLGRLYGDPFHSSLGYTFAVANYYEVTYHGFEATRLSAMDFIRTRGGELPGLILNQFGAHLPALTLPLLGLWPFALRWRSGEWAGGRRAAWLLVVITIVGHTGVWSAWGSSRYFLFCLLLLTPALLAKAEELWKNSSGEKRLWRAAAIVLPAVSALGLCVELGRTYARELSPNHGLPYLADVRRAVDETASLRLIATDRPSLLNLLREKPAVMLPYTEDGEKMRRFLAAYQPEALLLTLQPPLKAEAERIAASWRAGSLGADWKLTFDTGSGLLMTRASSRRLSSRNLQTSPRRTFP